MEDESKFNVKQHKLDDAEDQFLRERMERWGQKGRYLHEPYLRPVARKSKWLAGLLSFLFPGTGQLYLGLMKHGLGIMVLFVLNIFAIVFFGISEIIPLSVLFSLLLPVMYFYNIFDALQQTDRVNGWGYFDARGEGPQKEGSFRAAEERTTSPFYKRWSKGNNLGYMLIGAGVLIFLTAGRPAWLEQLFAFFGSTFGALLLIGLGLFLFVRESRK
ncbi:hypothetical protein [Paenibacillus sp. YYML68]|uniref:hypothetical protein n=1 Tax=Paenibacillus sp. YYML68 TaxID=2909250 RepID=UPI0024936F19|nr:hypothetical protein [Paenibacillus sp. YYML68]